MIRIDVLVSSPIFFVGLTHTFINAGIKVVAARTSPEEEPSWLADAAIIDVDALTPPHHLSHITETARSTAVLVLDNDTTPDTTTYLRAGAAGVISKRETCEGLVKAIRSITSGTPLHASSRSVAAPTGPPEPAAPHLSEREEQVLRQISRGLTHGQIATRLGISPHTVDTYVKRIRAKLGVGNKAELTRAALLGGLVTSPAATTAANNLTNDRTAA